LRIGARYTDDNYPVVRRAETFSATAVATNWLMPVPSSRFNSSTFSLLVPVHNQARRRKGASRSAPTLESSILRALGHHIDLQPEDKASSARWRGKPAATCAIARRKPTIPAGTGKSTTATMCLLTTLGYDVYY
jgi:hypothetical protein